MAYLNCLLALILIFISFNSQDAISRLQKDISILKDVVSDERDSNDKLKKQFVEYVKNQHRQPETKETYTESKPVRKTVGEPEKNLIKPRTKDCYYYTGAGEKVEFDCISGRPLKEYDDE